MQFLRYLTLCVWSSLHANKVCITSTITIKMTKKERKTRRIEEKETRETHVQQRLNEYIMLLLDNADQLLGSVVRYSNECY